MTNLLLADDHDIIRNGLKAVLSNEPEMNVVAEAENGYEVLEELKLEDKRIDVVILDIQMPEMDGVEAAREILKDYPEVKIIMLTMDHEETFIKNLLQMGVSGYLFKEEGGKKLVEAIKSVRNGKPYFGDQVKDVLVESIRNSKQSPNEDSPSIPDELRGLSDRELEVFKLIVQGMKAREMADELNIAIPTVETHKRNILRKTESKNIHELKVLGIENGFQPKKANSN